MRQIEVPRLGLHNACAVWLFSALLRSAAPKQFSMYSVVEQPSPSVFRFAASASADAYR